MLVSILMLLSFAGCVFDEEQTMLILKYIYIFIDD